jgi:23S rRNA (guanosine2251-2'-O)-methyltransferase
MYKIFGQHAMNGVMLNNRRKYKKLQKDHVETDKLLIETSLDDMLAQCNNIIILDNAKDVRNVGSIIRSAAILGFGVLLRNRCCINEISVKCAAGGVDNTPITFISDITNTIKKIKQHGFWFVALNEHGSNITPTFDKTVLVVGAEDCGISELVYKNCDQSWRLDSHGDFNVYNASVSASIAMYEIFKTIKLK